MRRRGKGEGSVYRRASDGLWVATLPPAPDPDGKVRTKTFTARTKTRALEKRTEYLAARARGAAAVRSTANTGTLLAYLLEWVEEHPLAESSRRAYRGHIRNHIGPRLGQRRPTAIDPQQVRDFLASLAAAGVSKSTVVRIRATLSKALNCAVTDNLIPYNPCTAARAPRPPSGKRTHKPFREEDIPLFAKVAREDRLWPLWALLLGTGARLGEVLSLRWEDVSLKAGTVHYRGGKTETSDRVMDLPSWALDALGDHQEVTGGRRGLVFATRTGQPISGRNVNRWFHRLLADAGIEDRRVHDTRHTFATLQLADGTDLQLIKELLGHASITITSQFYVSGSSRAKRAAARRADGWVALTA